jgi:hypothetical protein
MGAPRARSSASSGLAAANEKGKGVQLNGKGPDPAHGLAAVDAARIVHGGHFVVIERSRLAAAVAAGCAAHAGIAPLHCARCHGCVK